MPFARDRYVTDAIQLGPLVQRRVIAPYVVEPLETICASETSRNKYMRHGLGAWRLERKRTTHRYNLSL